MPGSSPAKASWCRPAVPASARPRSRWRRRSAARSITTVGDDEKAAKAKALGADHVINYRTERFEGVVRKLTGKKGVDVAFEHVGPDTFNGSLLCLKRGGRLVTCGSTSGQSTTINLFQLYLQQYRIFGSFGASMRNIRDSLDKMAAAAAGDRHRSAARRIRSRSRPARKPPSVRQDHRFVLERHEPRPFTARRRGEAKLIRRRARLIGGADRFRKTRQSLFRIMR